MKISEICEDKFIILNKNGVKTRYMLISMDEQDPYISFVFDTVASLNYMILSIDAILLEEYYENKRNK